jgi:hypothetical protein
MPKKPRSQRRGGGGKKGGDDDNLSNDVDFLSESHTIVTLNSNANGSMMEDDPSWGIDDDDDNFSNAKSHADNAVAAAEQRHTKLVDTLSTVDDYATEKRSAKREALLKGWFKALTQFAEMNSVVSQDTLYNHRDPLIHACRHGIRVGTPSEQYAACRVLEAAAILFVEEAYYSEVQGHLMRMVTSAHRATPVRVAALRALGMAVFLGTDDDEITEHLLDVCESLAQTEYRGNTVPLPLRAAALEVWTVLATTIHELYVAGKDDVSIGRGLLLLPLLLECLEQTEDASLRSAAGECVAWIHTCRLELGAAETAGDSSNTSNEQQPLNTTQKQYQQGSWEGSEWEDILSELEQVIDQLSNQSGHHMSKKAKKEQRSHFRDYLATIQDNEAPEEVVQFRGGSLELHSWKEIVALQFVRRCLQGGFQLQLLTNPTLQEVFGANGQALSNGSAAGLSQLEKRLFLSKTSEAAKVKDVDRHKKRDKRANIKNHFLTADGDDI